LFLNFGSNDLTRLSREMPASSEAVISYIMPIKVKGLKRRTNISISDGMSTKDNRKSKCGRSNTTPRVLPSKPTCELPLLRQDQGDRCT
jgi:hypothetical protein